MQFDESTTVASLMAGIPTTAFNGERRVIVGHPNDTVSDAQRLFFAYDLHHLPIVADGDQLVGMISVRDIMHAYERAPDQAPARVGATKLSQIMTTNPKSIRPSTSVGEAFGILAHATFQALPVVDPAGRIEGIVTTRDLVKLVNERLTKSRG